MKFIFTLFTISFFVIAAEVQARQLIPQQDTTFTITGSVTKFRVSDRLLSHYIVTHDIDPDKARNIMDFYKNRDYQYAWFNEDGLAEQTQSFWNLYENFLNYSSDSTLYDQELHDHMTLLLASGSVANIDDTEISSFELQLTDLFLRFVERAYTGSVDPKNIQWHIPRKKIVVLDLLNEFVKQNGKEPYSILPVSTQYLRLKHEIIRFKTLLENVKWPYISMDNKKLYRLGDSATAIPDIKDRLFSLGDLRIRNRSKLYDTLFENAVINFQRRHGLNDDGIIGPDFMKAINIPIESKIKQMLINLERMRWMPVPNEGKRVVVNIPEFKLYVYEGADTVLSTDIVVGKAAHRTVVFSDRIKHVVFSPYWNIPRSIVRNEILPAIDRDSRYLTRHNMEVTGNRNGLPVIRQRPGKKNALGRVKFIFPNRYSIYLHDTPAKALFQRTKRTFSHGCIRVADPAELASYLLKNNPAWGEQEIKKAMHADSEKWVALDEPVPVYISYFTAWVNQNGEVNFRDDVYGHDEKLAEHLF